MPDTAALNDTADTTAAEHLRHFWGDSLAEADPEVSAIIDRELGRQRDRIELIASENIASPAVLEATGSVFSMPRVIRAAATTAAATMPTKSRRSRSSARSTCSGASSPTSSPIRAAR
jgi:hypothetical protein